MDSIREALAEIGNSWNKDVPFTLAKLYGPVQAKQNSKYEGQVKAETAIKYGPDTRNRLDVYTPAKEDAAGGSGRPVVVFIHGGGLVTGDNNMYPNIGKYFVSHGYITCLVTYRLALQGGQHPHGAEDVTAALEWIQTNISKYGGDAEKVVALGQSAGGLHLATALFLGMLDPSPKPLLRGAVLLSAPFTLDSSDPGRAHVLKEWFQSNNLFEVNQRWSPAAIFRQQFFGTTAAPPREKLPCELLMLVGEADADEILDGTFEFLGDYRKRFSRLPVVEVLKGHNHVSYILGLGLDEPEYAAVGKRLIAFVREATV